MDDLSLEELQAALQTVQERKSTVNFFLESDHARDSLSLLQELDPGQYAIQADTVPSPRADKAER